MRYLYSVRSILWCIITKVLAYVHSLTAPPKYMHMHTSREGRHVIGRIRTTNMSLLYRFSDGTGDTVYRYMLIPIRLAFGSCHGRSLCINLYSGFFHGIAANAQSEL